MINPEDTSEDEKGFSCQIGDGGIELPIQANEQQTQTLISLFDSGSIRSGRTMLILDQRALSDGSTLLLPEDLEITIRQQKDDKFVNKSQSGIKPVLVVKVTDSEGRAVSDTADEVSDNVFGTDGDPVNLKTQISACSFGKVTMEPAETVGIYNGIDIASKLSASGTIEVTIPFALPSLSKSRTLSKSQKAAEIHLGFSLPGPFEHVRMSKVTAELDYFIF